MNTAYFLINTVFDLYLMVILLRVWLQWARADFYNPMSQMVVKLTNPLVIPLRRVIPGFGGIDLASVVLALVIAFANLEKKQGYRFRGNVVLHVDDDIYNEQVKVAEEKGTKKPAVIPVLEVTEIQDLASGPTAGKTIAKD